MIRRPPSGLLITGIACMLAGLVLGYWIWRPVSIHETAAPAVVLPSGVQVLERAPAAPVPTDIRQAAREAGGQLERAVSVTVRPRPTPPPVANEPPERSDFPPVDPGLSAPAVGCSCEDVTIDLGLVRMPDRTRRVVATSRGGEIIGGIDIPIDMAPVGRTKRWAAGVAVAQLTDGRRQYGSWVDRDLGPFRLGVEIGQRDGGAAVVLRAGIRF